jgi:trehalose 6-phosphate phosphatase
MSHQPPELDRSGSALFLDIDGTLLELEAHPDDVVADGEVIAILRALHADLDGAVALISGRAVEDIDRIFGPHRFPVAGEHGANIRLSDETIVSTQTNPLPESIVAKARAFAASREGLLLEIKSAGMALHYRAAPSMDQDCRTFMNAMKSELGEYVRLLEGKMVIELTPQTNDKGAAVVTLMDESPFRSRMPVFVGDDVTDEDAFSVVNDAGGISVLVGDRSDSAARYSLENVTAVRRWLSNSVGHDQ